MKIITWNCQGAFRKKAAFILQHQPDIVIIQECEHPSKLLFDTTTKKPTHCIWFGDNEHKGIGVFSYGDYTFELLKEHHPEIKIILPILVSGGKINFTLFAIWANNPQDKNNQYVGQIWKAIHHYEPLLAAENVILAGDFNSNTIWDKKNRIGNHSDVVIKLENKNIESIYHKRGNQKQGEEEHPTFYLYRNKTKPYHLDYLFASKNMMDKIEDFSIGIHENWSNHSDHTPLMVKFKMM
jgi:exodeoxyribonuclease III